MRYSLTTGDALLEAEEEGLRAANKSLGKKGLLGQW
jgi:hypothetical protein